MSDDVRIERDGSWTMLKEESRLRREKTKAEIFDRFGRIWQPTFCISCHKHDGWAPKTTWMIITQCDQCYQHYGPLPLPMLPEEDEVKWRTGKL